MSEKIGDITIPEPGASGAFPLTTSYPWSYESTPEVIVHDFANSVANLKISQRFYAGPRAKRFLVHCEMNEARRVLLADFWDARKGAYQAFDYAAPNEDGSHTHYNVRFENEPLSIEHLGAALCTSGIWLIEVPDPATAPVYTVSATQTRLTVHDDTLDAALRAQVQEVIPLIKIVVREVGYDPIYLSDRRVTVATLLYQPRLLDWSGIAQSIGGSSDLAQFTFGNADRVFTALANDTNLSRASIEFSIFHVGTTIKLDLWKGELTDWSCDEGPEFKVSASDGLYELNLPYPIRKVDRRCWKKAGDGINCDAAGACIKVFLKTAGDPGSDCTTLAQTARYGGINVKPQGVRIRDNSNKQMVTATSLVDDSVYGKVLPDVYTDREMLVPCLIASGRDESDFYTGLGIVGRGPIGSYGASHTEASDDGGIKFTGHRIDGQPHHGFGTAVPTDGLRTSLGPDPTTDNFSMLGEGDEHAAGTAWIELKRTDIKGIQPTKTIEHSMLAFVTTGLSGYAWTAPATRSALAVITNPVWVAVNTLLHALGLFSGATTAQQEVVFDTVSAAASAAVCNASVDRIIPNDGVHETQFHFVGRIAEQKPLRDWLQEILNNCCGYFVNCFGKLKIGIRDDASAVVAFTEGNILRDSLSLRPIKPAFNWLSAVFGNSEYEWKDDAVTLYDETHGVLIGGTVPVYNQAQINLVGTCTKSQAARIVTCRLREELGGTAAAEWTAARQISFRTTILALDVEAGMVCSLAHSAMPGGTGNFRATGWRLNKDWSIDIEGRTVTASMYDLTAGDKPADIVAGGLPGELVISTMPGDVAILGVDITEDGSDLYPIAEYEPPGIDSHTLGSFSGVCTYLEAPDASGFVQPSGEHDYDGDETLLGIVNTNGTAVHWVSGAKFTAALQGRRVIINSAAYPVLTFTDDENVVLTATAGVQNGVAYSGRSGRVYMKVPKPEAAETWRLYLAPKSPVYKKRLVLNGLAGETPNQSFVAGASEILPDVRTITADGTLAITDHTIIVDPTADDIDFTLLGVAAFAGRRLTIRRKDGTPGSGHVVNILPDGSDTVMGAASAVLSTDGGVLELVANG